MSGQEAIDIVLEIAIISECFAYAAGTDREQERKKDPEEGRKYSGCSVVVKPRTAITEKIVCNNTQPMLSASPAQKADCA